MRGSVEGQRQKSSSLNFCRSPSCFSPVHLNNLPHTLASTLEPALQTQPLHLRVGLVTVCGSEKRWISVSWVETDRRPDTVYGITIDQTGRIGINFDTVIASLDQKKEGWVGGRGSLRTELFICV